MEPLTTALLTAAFAAAADAILGGALDAVGGDAWAAAKTRLTGWRHLEEHQQQAAFARAVNLAVTTFRREQRPPPDPEVVLALFTTDSAEARRFQQLALEELLFSARPNLGRLLDYYRREVRFAALVRREVAPAWPELEPALHDFLGLLRQAMAKQDALRPLLPDETMLDLLATARAGTVAATDSAATLHRMEALLRELRDLPRIHATISAAEGARVSGSPLTVVLGNQTTYTLPAAPPPDLDALFRNYREFLSKTYTILDFRGIAQVQNVVRLRLDEIYVPLRGLVAGTRGVPPSDSADRTPDSATPLHNLVRDNPFLIILGEPGAGKSTLVKVLMVALAEGHAGTALGLSDEWLPIFFPVAAFAEARSDPGQRDLPPLDYLRIYFCGRNQPDYTPLFERALLAGRALLLLDGLDEVRQDRLALVRCLEDFIRAWDAPGNRFLATSRIAGYADAPIDAGIFTRATITPFADEQIRTFALRWSTAFERAGLPPDSRTDPLLEQRAAKRATDLGAAIFASPHITALARNPLLLTILAIIHNQGARLPDRRVDLYRLCVEALAETWNRARSLSGREIDVYLGTEKLDERFVVNLLGPAALWIHEANPGGIVEERDLERHLSLTLRETDGLPPRKADALAADFLRLVNRETGLLQERGHRRYGFLHLTFEEYLAARGLLESDMIKQPDAEIHRHASDPGWREVLRLAVASATQREASRLLLHLLDAPTDAQTHGRPVVLAGECLQDIGRNGATQRAWQAVITALLATIRDSQTPIATRIEAGHVLGRLGDPRLLDPHTGKAAGNDEAYAALEDYWCQIEPGPFWFGDERVESNEKGQPPRFDPAKLRQANLPHRFKLARYPVTNTEFAAFLAANGPDGYDPTKPWWTDEGRTFLAPGGHRYDDQAVFVKWPRLWDTTQYNSPAQPVVGVSWYEAAAYCRWLTGVGHEHGWLPQHEAIRLPTSLEWECAARPRPDQREHPYPWGDAPPTAEHANFKAAGVGAPSPVGCFTAGRAVCGAEDLVGNVLEWLATATEDEQNLLAFEPRKDFTLEQTPLLSFTYFRDDLDQMCCGARDRDYPFYRNYGWGFRVVQSLRAQA